MRLAEAELHRINGEKEERKGSRDDNEGQTSCDAWPSWMLGVDDSIFLEFPQLHLL
jgi:hypothetical protein